MYCYDPQSAGINVQSPQSESTPRRLTLVFPHIVSAETIFFFNLEIVANSNSCRKISIFYLIN